MAEVGKPYKNAIAPDEDTTITMAEWAEQHGYNRKRRTYRKAKVVPGAVPHAHTEDGPDPAA